MVRRWSYINQLNQPTIYKFEAARHSAFESTVNTYMYLRKPFYSSTKLTRRKWARRRHLTNWISLSAVMSNWSSSYRFYCNLEKSLYAQLLTRHSFIAFSVLSFKSSIPALHRSTEKIVASSLINKVFKYYANPSFARLRFFQTLKFTNITFISLFNSAHTSTSSVYNSLNDSAAVVPTLLDNADSFTSLGTAIQPTNDLSLLLSTILRMFLASVIALRRLVNISLLLRLRSYQL